MTSIQTQIGDLSIRRAAAPGDFGAVHAILAEAVAWLEQRGMKNQWTWVNTQQGKAFIRKRMEDHETYLVADLSARLIATFTIQLSDEDMWAQRGRDDGQTGYLHGLAICRVAAGCGVGYVLLDAAAKMLAARGRRTLRLDSMAENSKLCDYYRRAGFVEVGVAHAAKGIWASRLFERPMVAD